MFSHSFAHHVLIYNECCRFKEHFGSLEQLDILKSDANAIYEELVVRYPPVFCHMDTHNKNIVYDSKTGELSTYVTSYPNKNDNVSSNE